MERAITILPDTKVGLGAANTSNKSDVNPDRAAAAAAAMQQFTGGSHVAHPTGFRRL